jgi:hypothetical protein
MNFHFAFIILGYTLLHLKTSSFSQLAEQESNPRSAQEEWAALLNIPAVESTTVKGVTP